MQTTTRYSKTAGTFFPYDAEYAPEKLPPDLVEVSMEDYHAAMARPAGYAFDFVDGELVISAPPAPTLDDLKAAKNEEINRARLAANSATFEHAGKLIQCDALSRSDIDAVAIYVARHGILPSWFPGAWKTLDNDYVPIPDVPAWDAFYESMTAQGTANFNHAQALKAELAQATTAEQVAAITW